MPARPPSSFPRLPLGLRDLIAAAALVLLLCALPGCGGDIEPSATAGVWMDTSTPGTATPPPADPIAPPPAQAPEPPPTEAPASIELHASLSTLKRLSLDWTSHGTAFAERALVLEDPDRDGPLAEIPLAELPASASSAEVELFLPVARSASYRLALCGAQRCVHSAPLQLTGSLEHGMGRFKAQAPQLAEDFGRMLALSSNGRVLAVGGMTGRVHLFERTGVGQWVPRGQALGSGGGAPPNIAMALSADGQVLAVGGENTVWVYRRQGDQWLYSAAVSGSEVAPGDAFGDSLALSADGLDLVVAARGDDGTGDQSLNDGAVYVFRDLQGVWAQTQLLRDGNGAAGDRFGHALALSGEGGTLAVGSPFNDAAGMGVHAAVLNNSDAPNTGAVYLYRKDASGWRFEAFSKPPIDLGVGNYGKSVALDAQGLVLAVGAPDADLDLQGLPDTVGLGNSGSVHMLRFDQGLWAPWGPPLRAPTPQRDDQFGERVALSGNAQTLAVGTIEEDHSGVGVAAGESADFRVYSGSGYAFRRHGGGWGPATVLEPSDRSLDGQDPVRMGSAVAVSGDGRTLAVSAKSHGGPGAGVASDPSLDYHDDPLLSQSGTVFLY